MAFSDISNLSLANLLQIMFTAGVRDQLSDYHEEFNLMKQVKVDDSNPREIRFLIQKSRGPAAIQYNSPGDNSKAFPKAQRVSTSEGAAKTKELNATIEIEYQLWDRARKSPEKYAEPLALEMGAKELQARRQLAKDFYGDGTGVVCTVSSVSDTGLVGSAANKIVVTIRDNEGDRGFVGNLEFDDLLVAKQADGSAVSHTETAGTSFYAWQVIGINRASIGTSTVTLAPVDSSGVVVTDITASGLAAGNVLYRVGQITFPNLSSIADYGVASEVLVGLESLISDDGRTVHGLAQSGSFSGSVLDFGDAVVDTLAIQQAMDKVKNRVGQNRYAWSKILCAPEAAAVLIEGRESDRRFITLDDATRGVKKFAYQHYNSSLEFQVAEFCPFRRMFILPGGKEKVLQMHMTDMVPVRAENGDAFHIVPGANGGHSRLMASYLMGHLTFLNTHPAGCVKIKNFKLA